MRTMSLFALLFQLAWSTVIPVIHAESEALSSQAHYESKHSDDCVRLHDPAHSATCSAVSAPLSKAVRYQIKAPGHAIRVTASSVDVQVRSAGFNQLHLARSPPLVH